MTPSSETYSELADRTTALIADLGEKWEAAGPRERAYLTEAGNLLERASAKITRTAQIRAKEQAE